MTIVYLVSGMIIGAGMVIVIGLILRKKRMKKIEVAEREKIDITLQDIIRLAALNTSLDVGSLIIEYKINIKLPGFYERFLALNKNQREQYFNELIFIFTKNKRGYVENLLDLYPGLSSQDILLLLMREIHLDNKTMARILGLGAEAFKKRRTRLKAKMQRMDLTAQEATAS